MTEMDVAALLIMAFGSGAGFLAGFCGGFLGLGVVILGGFSLVAVNRQRVLLLRAREEGRRLRQEADWPAGGGESDE